MRIAVIPARGGSKRIPKKNLRTFCGKPMIEWSIQAACASNIFNRVIVSTDDDEIAKIASACGADVPFIRPSDLSNDYADTSAVMSHAVRWIVDQGLNVDYVCCIYATAPFITADDISNGLNMIQNSDADYAFTVTTYAFPVQRSIRISETNRIEMCHPEYADTRSQDLEEIYHDAGQFYWGTAGAWISAKPIFSGCALPIVLPRYRVQDIDTAEDWERAELMFKVLSGASNF